MTSVTDEDRFLRIAPPALPTASPEYSKDIAGQHNNILRLFFNRLVNSLNRHTELLDITLRPTIKTVADITYELLLEDERSIILCTNAAAVTVTVPKDATTDFPIGYITHVYQQGSGQVTLSPEDGTVSINAASSPLTRTQYSALSIVKVGANTYNIIGDQE